MIKIIKNKITFNVNPSNDYFTSFWSDVSQNKWENNTFKILDKYLTKNSCVIDIGAWIGPITLYAAKIASKVYAFEPDPIAFEELKKNIESNYDLMNKVTICKQCINIENGYVNFGNAKKWGNSGSSIFTGKGFAVDSQCDQAGNWKVNSKVEAITLETFLQDKNIINCDFIKIDIEGGEAIIIPSIYDILRQYKPTLHLSLHRPFLPNPNKDINNIINTLQIYPNIYNSNGKKININSIKNMTGFYDIVCTTK